MRISNFELRISFTKVIRNPQSAIRNFRYELLRLPIDVRMAGRGRCAVACRRLAAPQAVEGAGHSGSAAHDPAPVAGGARPAAPVVSRFPDLGASVHGSGAGRAAHRVEARRI